MLSIADKEQLLYFCLTRLLRLQFRTWFGMGASVHTMPEQFENGRKLEGNSSLQDFDAKEVRRHKN